ncbi:MAG TPA: ABC transporter permease [Vicinamibacterales bacterium]|nr:ABC transporter permease [Vicinamibacterales bacterium]
MDAFLNDLKYASRGLLRSPGFALSAILTLALGIGANSVIFTGVYRLLFDPMPFLKDADRLMSVWEVAPGGRNDHNEFSLGDFRDLRSSTQSFESLAAHAWLTINLTGGDRPERVQGFRVTSNFFDTLGIQPALGRTFQRGEDEPGRDDVVMISDGLWRRRFGGNPAIVGQRIAVNGVQRTVVGVLPAGVRYPAPGDLWMPFAYTAQQWSSRQSHFLLVTGRLKSEVGVDPARDEVRTISSRLTGTDPDTNSGWSSTVQPLISDSTRTIGPMLLSLFAAVGLVLLISCANVANLLLARGAARERELALRAALGAARGRLQQQLFVESVLIAACGGAAAFLFCLWAIGAISALVPAQYSRFINGFDRLAVDGPVIAFTASISLLTSVLFGLLPAIKAARRNLLPVLQERARTFSDGRHGTRRLLVAAEVALAALLLIGAGLVLRSFHHSLSVDLGFTPAGVATTSVVLPSAKYATPEMVGRFYERAVAGLAALPGVNRAAAVNVTPLCQCNETTSFDIEGRPPFEKGKQPDVGYRVITPEYFAVMSIPMLAGRSFTAQDRVGQPLVVIVNQTLARRFLADRAPLGVRLRFGGPETSAEIVGVVADVRHRGPTEPADPEVYFPESQEASQSMTFVVQTSGDPGAMLAPIRAAIQSIDPEQPVYDQRTMRDVVNLAVGLVNFARQLLAAMALVALVLAAIGIYGVVSHVVAERSREIGIRLALGGTRRIVVRRIVAQAVAPAVWGLAIGLVAAAGLTAAFSFTLAGVKPLDPLTFTAASVLLFLAALVAGYVPARRAARVDPAVTLRSE